MKQNDRSTQSTRTFFMMLEERAGRRAAAAACTLCLWFFLAHTAVFARLWAELLRVYLAPGALMTALSVLPILSGILYIRRGQRFYAHAGRYLEIAMLVLCAGFVRFAYDRTPIGWLHDGAAYSKRIGAVFPGVEPGRWEFAAALFLLGGFFFAVAVGIRCVRSSYDYLYPLCAEFYRGQTVRAIRERLRGVRTKLPGAFGAGAGADSEKDTGLSGTEAGSSVWENGMITETVKLYGTEFAEELAAAPEGRRMKFWGVKRTKKLSGLPYVGTVSRYGERISEELTATHIWWWVAVLTVYALTVGFANAFAAVAFYRAYNLQILVPVLLAFSAVTIAVARMPYREKGS